MIKQLRQKQRIDSLPNDVRIHKHRFGRWIYLFLLFGFFLWISDLFIGPLLRLQADGLVVSDRISIATPFAAQVVDVTVAPGSKVKAGDVLAQVNSIDLTKDIASMTARNADLLIKRVDIERRTRIAEAVMPIAQDRAVKADAALQTIQDVRKRGHVTQIIWTATLQERFTSNERVAELEAEIHMARTSVSAADAAIADSLTALNELRLAYNSGIVSAPEDGIVGLKAARPGDILPVGEPIMTLYGSKPYVLAYLETGTLYTVSPGDEVRLSNGFTQTKGWVSEVLPVADQLPEEFRKTFQPRGRSQVVRIEIAENATFPLFSEVFVSGMGWLAKGTRETGPEK